ACRPARRAGRQGRPGGHRRGRGRPGPDHRPEAGADPDLRDVPPRQRAGDAGRRAGTGRRSTIHIKETRQEGGPPGRLEFGGDLVTTTQTKTRTIPAPFYAAAGAADLAYQKLRDLQAKVNEQRVRTGARDLDIDKLREAARRNAAAVVAGAQAAQEKAVALYTDLVARGEKVVKGG